MSELLLTCPRCEGRHSRTDPDWQCPVCDGVGRVGLTGLATYLWEHFLDDSLTEARMLGALRTAVRAAYADAAKIVRAQNGLHGRINQNYTAGKIEASAHEVAP